MSVIRQGHQKFPPEYIIQKPNQIACFSTDLQSYFPTNEKEVSQCSQSKVRFAPMKSFSFMVAGSSSVSISYFKAQSSIGCLFFDGRNSIVSGVNFWCPYERIFLKELLKMVEFRKTS